MVLIGFDDLEQLLEHVTSEHGKRSSKPTVNLNSYDTSDKPEANVDRVPIRRKPQLIGYGQVEENYPSPEKKHHCHVSVQAISSPLL